MNRIWNKSHRNNCSLLLILLLGFILWQTPVHASEFNFAVDFELPANQIDKNKIYKCKDGAWENTGNPLHGL